jgi:hypothetical protein
VHWTSPPVVWQVHVCRQVAKELVRVHTDDVPATRQCTCGRARTREGRLLRLVARPARRGALPTTPVTPSCSIEPGEAWRWCFVDEVAG